MGIKLKNIKIQSWLLHIWRQIAISWNLLFKKIYKINDLLNKMSNSKILMKAYSSSQFTEALPAV